MTVTHGNPHISPTTLLSATTLLAVAVLAMGWTTPALADLALARSKNCMGCHAVERKLIGPSFRDVAARYKGNTNAVEMLATKIRKGGAGVWGPVPMPANSQVNEAEARKLAEWVLATPAP